MGRYYSGDIEGKFWFAVQNSNDASFFGGEECEPNYISYSFSKENDMKSVEDGLKACLKELGKYKAPMDKFFKEAKAYNNEELSKAISVPIEKIPTLLEWYARYSLGSKIHKCLKKEGYCNFEAEL